MKLRIDEIIDIAKKHPTKVNQKLDLGVEGNFFYICEDGTIVNNVDYKMVFANDISENIIPNFEENKKESFAEIVTFCDYEKLKPVGILNGKVYCKNRKPSIYELKAKCEIKIPLVPTMPRKPSPEKLSVEKSFPGITIVIIIAILISFLGFYWINLPEGYGILNFIGCFLIMIGFAGVGLGIWAITSNFKDLREKNRNYTADLLNYGFMTTKSVSGMMASCHRE